jgi:hemolysin D
VDTGLNSAMLKIPIVDTKSKEGRVVRLVAITMAIALLWTLFTELEVVVVGNGVLKATEQVKIVRTMDAGVVRTLLASEGHEVKSGQPLLKLDYVAASTQIRELEIERKRLSTEAHLAKEILHGTSMNSLDESVEGLLPMSIADRDMLTQELTVWRRKNTYQDSVEESARASVENARHTLDAANESLAFQTRRHADLTTLVQRDFMTKHALQDVEQSLLHARSAQSSAKSRLALASAELETVRNGHNVARKERERDAYRTWRESIRQLEENMAALVRAEAHIQRLTLRTPIDGIILSRSADTEGSAISAGEEAFRIAPLRQPLRIEARFEHKDIAHLHPGMTAHVKVEALPFPRYGMVTATLISIAPDSLDDQQGKRLYKAQLKPISQDNRPPVLGGVELRPGMVVAVEIATRSRSVFDYLWSPLIRHLHESAREP